MSVTDSEFNHLFEDIRPITMPIDEVITLHEVLGKGSFGEVRLGRLISSKKKVAVKIIQRKSVTSRRKLHQLVREIKTLSSLSHPNIIAFYGCILNKECVYILLENAKGGELFDEIVSRGCIPEGEAAKLFTEMLSAISFVHSKRIVHRDIKPENFLLQTDETGKHIRLSDFGFCNTKEEGRLVFTPCGSPTYAAPEIYRNAPYDLRVDIWSLGIVLYVMITGCSPWGAQDSNQLDSSLRDKLAKGQYVPLPASVSPECSNLIRSLVQPDPNNRITIKAALSHPWIVANVPEQLRTNVIFEESNEEPNLGPAPDIDEDMKE